MKNKQHVLHSPSVDASPRLDNGRALCAFCYRCSFRRSLAIPLRVLHRSRARCGRQVRPHAAGKSYAAHAGLFVVPLPTARASKRYGQLPPVLPGANQQYGRLARCSPCCCTGAPPPYSLQALNQFPYAGGSLLCCRLSSPPPWVPTFVTQLKASGLCRLYHAPNGNVTPAHVA